MYKGGGKNVVLGKKIRINTTKYLQVGNGVEICDNARLLFVDNYAGERYDPTTIIGNNILIGFNFTIMSAAPIVIKDNVLIASNVLITSENHGLNPEIAASYAPLPLIGAPVSIEEGCWIGEKVMILSGVSLGKRCIVASGAVVTKSFPDYSMIAGVPAKCIKKYSFQTHEWIKCD